MDVDASDRPTRRDRLRWWLDLKPYAIGRPGNLLMCRLTGHVEIENVNVRSRWDTHCAWCQKGYADHQEPPYDDGCPQCQAAVELRQLLTDEQWESLWD